MAAGNVINFAHNCSKRLSRLQENLDTHIRRCFGGKKRAQRAGGGGGGGWVGSVRGTSVLLLQDNFRGDSSFTHGMAPRI